MISWVGGKSIISKFIIPYISKDIINFVEPFAGMGWVFFKMDLKKYPNLKNIVLNDINKLNTNLFKCSKQYDRLYEEMEKYPYQKLGEDIDPQQYIDVFNQCQKEVFDPNFILSDQANFDIAAKYLYVLCHVFSGSKPGSAKFIYYHGKYRDKCLVFMDKLKDPKWREHFDKLNIIENIDACEIISKYDSESTYFYCDPPYANTEHYYSNHDFGKADHERLSNCLTNIKGKFSLSYYDFPDLHKWYPPTKFRWESQEFSKSAAASKGKKQNKGTELLIMNYGLEGRKSGEERHYEYKAEELASDIDKEILNDIIMEHKKHDASWGWDVEKQNEQNYIIDVDPIASQISKELDDVIMSDIRDMNDKQYQKILSDLKNARDRDNPVSQKIIKDIKQKILENDALGHYDTTHPDGFIPHKVEPLCTISAINNELSPINYDLITQAVKYIESKLYSLINENFHYGIVDGELCFLPNHDNFPIEWEMPTGKYAITKGCKIMFQPKQNMEYINMSINISPTKTIINDESNGRF